jgi:hypothetical protein
MQRAKVQKAKVTQKAGAWFNGAHSPLMIDTAIAPNMFQAIPQRRQRAGSAMQKVQPPRLQKVQPPRLQKMQLRSVERVPLPSRQVNETYAPFKLQQGGTMSQQRRAQQARKAAQARAFALRRGAGMQAARLDNLGPAARTRSQTKKN